jgi:hypothetical protein
MLKYLQWKTQESMYHGDIDKYNILEKLDISKKFRKEGYIAL